jgi:signal transduction histidine kinase
VVGRHAAVAVELIGDCRSALLVPLGSRPAGGMIVTMRARDAEPFDAEDLDQLTAFAMQTAVALELAHSQRRERELQVQADRDRIARDLHDHVVQRVFATGLALDRLSRSLPADQIHTRAALSRSVDELDDTISEIRAAIFELHEDHECRTAPEQQLAEVVRRVTEGSSLRRDLRVRGAVDDLPAALLADITAVVRELVTNVVRHAGATRVTVLLTAEDEVSLVVSDDGVGIPPQAARSGLANLTHRAERRGGRLTTRVEGSGSEVRWAVPRPG